MEDTSSLPSASLMSGLAVQIGIASQLYIGLLTRLLEPHDLTYPQFSLLMHLSRRKRPARISDMAQAVELTQPAVSKAIQKFTQLGLVDVAKANGGDMRSRFVTISPAGIRQISKIQEAFGPVFENMLQGWNANEVTRLSGDLARLIGWLDAQPRLGKSELDVLTRQPDG